MLQIKARKLNPHARLPEKAHPSDAGWDLFACEDFTLFAGRTCVVPTGVALEIPEGWYGQVFGRSSLAAEGVTVGGGVIDHGFTGEVGVILSNTGSFRAFNRGDKVAQLVILPVPEAVVVEAEELAASARGDGGFGSSGT